MILMDNDTDCLKLCIATIKPINAVFLAPAIGKNELLIARLSLYNKVIKTGRKIVCR